MPRSAPSRSIAVSGPGCGGTRPCIAERPASAGIPTVISDSWDAPGDQVDDRHQQHQADLEEHRQADDRADQRHRPRQRPRRGVSDDGVDDLVGAAGIGEQFGEHRAERDQDADARRGGAESVGERRRGRREVLARDDAHGQGAEDQGEERVQLGDGDQHDDQRDTGQRGQDQLPAGGDGLGQLGVGRQEGE